MFACSSRSNLWLFQSRRIEDVFEVKLKDGSHGIVIDVTVPQLKCVRSML